MHDSRDNEDMPRRGWYLDLNNLAYREGLGGEASFDAYRADLRVFWPQRGGHLLAFRQYNWLTHDAPSAAQATVVLRGYKLGQYLAPYMSSFEAEERLSFGSRWAADDIRRRGGPVRRPRRDHHAPRLLPELRRGPSLRHQTGPAHAGESRIRARRRGQPRSLPEVRLRLVIGDSRFPTPDS